MTDDTAADEARGREAIAAVVAYLEREFPGAGVRHHEGPDGDWNFDVYMRGDRYPRRLVVTRERITDEEAGRTMAEAVTASLEQHRAAEQLRRQPGDRELIIGWVLGGPRKRGA
jgi:hypothetical protein